MPRILATINQKGGVGKTSLIQNVGYELGLVYEVNVNDDAHVDVKMTLTSPSCPVAESMPNEVEQKVGQTHGVSSAKVELTFEPPWDRTMMSEAAQLELGFM